MKCTSITQNTSWLSAHIESRFPSWNQVLLSFIGKFVHFLLHAIGNSAGCFIAIRDSPYFDIPCCVHQHQLQNTAPGGHALSGIDGSLTTTFLLFAHFVKSWSLSGFSNPNAYILWKSITTPALNYIPISPQSTATGNRSWIFISDLICEFQAWDTNLIWQILWFVLFYFILFVHWLATSCVLFLRSSMMDGFLDKLKVILK